MNFPNPNNNEMCNFDMSWLTNQQQQGQQQQQLPAKDMNATLTVNSTTGLQLVRQLELRSDIGIVWNGSQGITSPHLVSAPSLATTSTAASATTSPHSLTLPHNHDAELRLDPLEVAAAPAPLNDWQIETLAEMLSKPDEVNNPPQKEVKKAEDLSTLFQIIGKGIDSGAPNCTYEQAVQLLKRLQLYDLVLNGIIRVPGISREERSRVSSRHLVSPSASAATSTAASATSSPLTLPQYNDDAELQQDLLMMGAESLLGSQLIQTPPTSPKLAATPAPLRNWQIETVNGMLSQPDEVNPQQQKKKVDAALLQQQPEVQKTTELTRQVTPDQKKKEATSVDRHNSVSNVQQREVDQQAPAKLPLKKRPVDKEKNQASSFSFLPIEEMESQHPRVSSSGMKSLSSLGVSTSKTVAAAASSSMIQNDLRELVREQQSQQAMLDIDRKEAKKKLFQQRVFSTAKMPPKKKASSKKKTATLYLRPDKGCRREGCGSTKQAGYDGYCIRHCREFNNAKYEETKEQNSEKKKAAEKKKLVV